MNYVLITQILEFSNKRIVRQLGKKPTEEKGGRLETSSSILSITLRQREYGYKKKEAEASFLFMSLNFTYAKYQYLDPLRNSRLHYTDYR